MKEILHEPLTCPADRYILNRDKVLDSIIKSVLNKIFNNVINENLLRVIGRTLGGKTQ